MMQFCVCTCAYDGLHVKRKDGVRVPTAKGLLPLRAQGVCRIFAYIKRHHALARVHVLCLSIQLLQLRSAVIAGAG